MVCNFLHEYRMCIFYQISNCKGFYLDISYVIKNKIRYLIYNKYTGEKLEANVRKQYV